MAASMGEYGQQAVVVTVKVDVAPVPGMTLVGENEQEVKAGKSEQESETASSEELAMGLMVTS